MQILFTCNRDCVANFSIELLDGSGIFKNMEIYNGAISGIENIFRKNIINGNGNVGELGGNIGHELKNEDMGALNFMEDLQLLKMASQ